MKEFGDAKRLLEDKRNKLEIQRKKIEGDIYKLNLAMEKLSSVEGLLRVRRVSYDKKCAICGKDFKAKVQQQLTCSRACKNKLSKKGVTLIAGAQK